jgi:DNA-binding transcriptional regulator YiaG
MAYKHITRVGRYKVEDGTRFAALDEEATVDLTLAELAGYERRAAKTVLLDVPAVEGDVLKFARKALGLKQVELAAILDVTAETISRWETGADSFKRPVQLAYAQLLDIAERLGTEAIRHLADLTAPGEDVVLRAS